MYRYGAAPTVLMAIVLTLGGCGSARMTADARCGEYLQQPGHERSDTAIRLSSELRAKFPGNPMWAPNLDFTCGSRPNLTLRQAFGK